ncbi:TIGR00266 family protein [Pseudomonas sp. N040]|uniref:TIGR00266 family protein n=1 Tax=Pseudomonas sp. N040 TaxID=2785325 RepID=UPI0018A2FFD7|nr:TIGR00266 family protein [Pseudomonas sp. N040]MBF7730625.1 TIGR00266 family protein [Pseudomonas sp. N040]MBW7014268.1 TIGR00266 family protein [Pseudomonas sp. N040]
MPSHQLDYEILGAGAQAVEIILDPGETVIAEAGAMNYMTEGIRFDTRMGDGSASGLLGKLWGAGKRLLTGESLFLTHFSNAGTQPARVGFAAPYPGTVVPIELGSLGGHLICQKDAFLCAAFGTQVGISFSKRIGAGFFGGEGFILQRLEGDGLAFVHAGGTLIRKQLDNETLRLDTGCLVAFSSGIDYDIGLAGGLKSMLFGGEGILLATLKGTGTVWIQSLPFSRLAERIYEATFKAREEVRAGGQQ